MPLTVSWSFFLLCVWGLVRVQVSVCFLLWEFRCVYAIRFVSVVEKRVEYVCMGFSMFVLTYGWEREY